MAVGIYAGTTALTVAELPSPVEVKPTYEIIWSENTGRAQSGANKAKMIGDVVAEKKTYSIKWGIIDGTDFTSITTGLKAGFFYFAVAPDLATAKSTATPFYRSEIAYEILPVGSDTFYKDVSVSVIEQ